MSEAGKNGDFDPYHKWLGIAPSDQPPNHYQLLGVPILEDDPEVIEAAADRQMAYVQQCATGNRISDSQRILNELSKARVTLLNPKLKAEYDRGLKSAREESEGFPPIEPGEQVRSVRQRTSRPQNGKRTTTAILIAAGAVVVVGVVTALMWPEEENEIALRQRRSGGRTERKSDDAQKKAGEKSDFAETKPLLPGNSPNSTTQSPLDPSPNATSVTPPVQTPPKPAPSATSQSVPAVSSTGGFRVADRLQGKAKPTGVPPTLLTFNGPSGDGRRGANGVFIPAEIVGGVAGATEWSCSYQRDRSARGIQFVHPVNDGHVVVTVYQQFVNVVPGGGFPGYLGRDVLQLSKTSAFAEHFPLKDKQTYEVASRVFPSGQVAVLVNETVVATATVSQTAPLIVEKFPDNGLPREWPAGSTGVIIGPLDGGINRAENVVFSHSQTEAPPSIAAKEPISAPSSPTPAPSNPSASPPPATTSTSTANVAGKQVTLDVPSKDVVAVWGIHDEKGTYRVALFEDGSTNQSYDWSPISPVKFGIHDGSGDLVNDGVTVLGSWKNGGIFDGRRLMQNCWLAGTTDRFTDEETPSIPLTAFETNLVDVWQLTAQNRRANAHVSVPVQITANRQVIEAGRTVAFWKTDRNRVEMQFVDPSVGTALLSPRKKDELSGRANSASDQQQTVRLDRVKKVSTWETDRLGKIVLYTNGRVSDPLGEKGHGFWWQDGSNFRFSRYRITIGPQQRTFTGADKYGTGIKGQLLP